MTKLLRTSVYLFIMTAVTLFFNSCSDEKDWLVYDSLRDYSWVIEYIDNPKDSPFNRDDLLYFHSDGTLDIFDYKDKPITRGRWSNNRNELYIHIEYTYIKGTAHKRGTHLIINCIEPETSYNYILHLTRQRSL